MSLRDGARLSVGTLTRIPVRPPQRIDAASGAAAMLLAPLAVAPVAVGLALLLRAGAALGIPPLAIGFVALAGLAFATRMLHLDGLSDTVDGLTASRDRQRSLEVMRSGTAGPAGVVALVVVVSIQAVALGQLSASWSGALAAGTALMASRTALTLACTRGVPAARTDGLGAAVAGTVPPLASGVALLLTALALWFTGALWGAGSAAVVAPAAALLSVLACLQVAVRRLGGVTGDVLGATVEVSFAVVLLCLA